jgi:ADP-heptose:LPS heptosyltransferase
MPATQTPITEEVYRYDYRCKVVEFLADQVNLLQLDVTETPKALKLSPMLGIGKCIALFEQLSRFIGIDAYPMHLAVSCNLPSGIVRRASNPKACGYENHLNLRAPGCAPGANTDRLTSYTGRTSRELISADEITEAVYNSARLTTELLAN